MTPQLCYESKSSKIHKKFSKLWRKGSMHLYVICMFLTQSKWFVFFSGWWLTCRTIKIIGRVVCIGKSDTNWMVHTLTRNTIQFCKHSKNIREINIKNFFSWNQNTTRSPGYPIDKPEAFLQCMEQVIGVCIGGLKTGFFGFICEEIFAFFVSSKFPGRWILAPELPLLPPPPEK